MIDWLMMLYDYPIHTIEDDPPHVAIKNAYNSAKKISDSIEQQVDALEKQRREIDLKL